MENLLHTPSHKRQKHYSTPQRARIQGAKALLEAKRVPSSMISNNDLFGIFGVTRRSGYRMLKSTNSRSSHHVDDEPESRGRKPLLTREDLRKMEDFLEGAGAEQRAVTWRSLATLSGITKPIGWRTIQRAMASLDYHKCIACSKQWVSMENRRNRVAWAKEMLAKYPRKEDWRFIRFSDEVHFGLGPQKKLRIIRRKGERYCSECIQDQKPPDESDFKRLHCWAVVGYDYKLEEIVFYDAGNRNGKMNLKTYRDDILEKVVLLEKNSTEKPYILFEDNDSGHGPSASNLVRSWKESHGLEFIFNAPYSPDLNIIENCWQPLKEAVNAVPHWEEDGIKWRIQSAWKERLKQASINRWVDSMPDRLHQLLDREGKMTGY